MKHLPWMMWGEWIKTLSQFNVGIQLGTASAGTLTLIVVFMEYLYWLFKCEHSRYIHPLTTVEVGDIDNAKHIARKLKDEKFYNLCSETTIKDMKHFTQRNICKKCKEIMKTI